MKVTFPKLSTGMQRLLFFMRALIKRPEVLLLDEPYQALGRRQINACNRLLMSVLSDRDTLIFISHFKDEVPSICNLTLDLEPIHRSH